MRLKLSVQSLNALMAALQNSLATETDIVPTLIAFDWEIYDSQGNRIGFDEDDPESQEVFGLWVKNPPVVKGANGEEIDIAGANE